MPRAPTSVLSKSLVHVDFPAQPTTFQMLQSCVMCAWCPLRVPTAHFFCTYAMLDECVTNMCACEAPQPATERSKECSADEEWGSTRNGRRVGVGVTACSTGQQAGKEGSNIQQALCREAAVRGKARGATRPRAGRHHLAAAARAGTCGLWRCRWCTRPQRSAAWRWGRSACPGCASRPWARCG